MKEIEMNELKNINGGLSKRVVTMIFSLIGVYGFIKNLRKAVLR